MDQFYAGYLTGELTQEEKEELLLLVAQDKHFREELLDTQNIYGISAIMPQDNDILAAQESLAMFMEAMKK